MPNLGINTPDMGMLTNSPHQESTSFEALGACCYHLPTERQKAKRPTPKSWPKRLNLLVVMGRIELPTYGL